MKHHGQIKHPQRNLIFSILCGKKLTIRGKLRISLTKENYYLAYVQLQNMKKIILLFICVSFLFACSSKKGYLERKDSDRSLQDAVKKINRAADDEDARQAIPQLYTIIKEKRLDNINAYTQSNQLSKWDKIVNEYEYLQNAYSAIISSPAAFKLVTPESYSTELVESKENAASAYYDYAMSYFQKPGRDNAKAAYNGFKKVNQFAPGYKDVNEKIKTSYENSIITIVISPVQDNSFFNNNGWGNYGMNYSNEYFQQNLLRDLSSNNQYPARFYTRSEASRMNIYPDWTIDFRLRNITVPNPLINYSSRNVSNQLQVGTDTAGRPVYNTVNATINISRSSFTARANMEMNINDLTAGKNIIYRSYNEEYKWEQQSATFSGDRRAISQSDWSMINNSNNTTPRKEEVLYELYRKIYPQVLSQIRQSVSW